METLKGIANDGTIFTLESDAVIALKQQYPDLTDEAAIGGAVNTYNNQIDGKTEEEVLEETSDLPEVGIE